MRKSKLFAALLAMLLALSCVFVACDGGKTPPEPTTYTVTFNLNGAPGTAPAAQTIEEGKKASKPTDPTWTDYDFGGWYTEAAGTTKWEFDTNTVTKDITLYAKWTEKTSNVDPAEYTVTFNANGGKFADDKETMTAETVNGKVSAPANPTREGYTFVAWYQDKAKADAAAEDGRFDFNTALTAATTLYAGWEQNVVVDPSVEYTVTFNANEGEFADGEATMAVETVNGKVTAPATNPTREGYTFVAWYQDKAKADAAAEDGRFDFNTALTAATTLYAGWEQNVVENPVAITITLHANGGLFEDETDTATYTVENVDEFDPDEDFPYFERTGYDFVGWYTDADCTEAWDGTVSEGLKLWADWEAVEFAVEFNANGGTFPIDATKYIAEKYAGETLTEQEVASITEPTRYGYDFAGWFLDEQGETAWDFSATLTGVEVFYAKWTKKTGLVQEDYVGENLNFNEFPAYMTNYEFAGEIDGEEVTFTIIGFDCDEDGNVVSSSKILWEGHVINIKSIDFSWGETTITAEIDGVDVKIILQDNLDFLTLTIEREGYEDIELSYWPYL